MEALDRIVKAVLGNLVFVLAIANGLLCVVYYLAGL